MSESYSYLFAVPSDYKITEEKFKKSFIKYWGKSGVKYDNKYFIKACDIIDILTGRSGPTYSVHCQDNKTYEMWDPLVRLLKNELVVIDEIYHGSSGCDTLTAIKKEIIDEAFLVLNKTNVLKILKKICR